MRQLDDDRVYKDAQELERLQTLVAEGLKRFEFGLRRKVEDAEGDQPALTATDEVPRGFRDLVVEYYRSLSKRGEVSSAVPSSGCQGLRFMFATSPGTSNAEPGT